jgi:hypothetical protein
MLSFTIAASEARVSALSLVRKSMRTFRPYSRAALRQRNFIRSPGLLGGGGCVP